MYEAWAASQAVGAVGRHHVSSPVIHITGDKATAQSYLRAETVLSDGTWTADVGHYDDELQRSPDGRWQLTVKGQP